MKSVRVFYRKNGPLRFVSHLDMSRLVTRMLRRTGLEVWYTEGFNSRLYILHKHVYGKYFSCSVRC